MKLVKFKIPERMLVKEWLGPQMVVEWDFQKLLREHSIPFCKRRKIMFFKSVEEGLEFTLRYL